MKTQIALLLTSGALLAGEVRLAWDAPTPAPPGLTYRLYAHTNLGATTNYSAAATRVNVGTNQTALVDLLSSGTWYFFATAIDTSGLESDPSNVLVGQMPAAPGNMRTVILQSTTTLTNGAWHSNLWLRLVVPAP